MHLYLRSGREKLRCTTTEQAIAKVMALECIEYVGAGGRRLPWRAARMANNSELTT